MLQQYLPLAVLKQKADAERMLNIVSCNSTYRLRYWNDPYEQTTMTTIKVATVLTACGIETNQLRINLFSSFFCVATVLTACGIETLKKDMGLATKLQGCNSTYRLRYWNAANVAPFSFNHFMKLQQYLPLAVLKLGVNDFITFTILIVATVLTACGIETLHMLQ